LRDACEACSLEPRILARGLDMNIEKRRRASDRILLLLACAGALVAQPARFKIPDGTSLRLALTETLSSATNQVDNPVGLEVTEDVKVGDVIAIPKGATALGHVVEAEPKRRMGRAGKLNFSVDHVKAPDGTNVRLRASSARKGDDKTGTVIVGTVLLSPLFLIMRGKDVNIPKGTVFTAYVDGDRDIALGPAASTQTLLDASPAPLLSGAEPPPETQRSPVSIRSEPEAADITIDGKYAGSTPSIIQMGPGEHRIAIEKAGFKVWDRTISVTAGSSLNMNATLQKN
jgi:hypothetical protein